MSKPTATRPARDVPYEDLFAALHRRFAAVMSKKGTKHLFRAATPPLQQIWLAALPAELRQEHTCGACRRFFDRFGGLVTIDDDGRTVPAMWDAESAPEPYAAAVRALAGAVAQAPISGVFLARETVWGTPRTGEWEHLAVTPPKWLVHEPSPVKTTGQTIAEKLHDREILLRGLADFPLDLVKQAHGLLSGERLFRSEKSVGVAKWLLDLHTRLAATRDERVRDNLVWLAVAGAPAGFCHVRSTMIGTLLEDLKNDMPFDQLRARFAAKMDTLQYQRPTAAPSAGNIAQAEKIVAELKAAGALEQRFARLSDIQALWKSAHAHSGKKAGKDRKGTFSHLKAAGKTEATTDLPTTTMTWEKFARTVLPNAEQIEFLVPPGKSTYLAFVTAKHADAAPIVQWDSLERRNPVTCYVYHGGSPPQQWGLTPGVYHAVTAVALQPAHWDATKKFPHIGETVTFILAGAKDLEYKKGAGLFPEWLKSEYHPIRATLEAYTREAVVAGKEEAEACGIGLAKGGTWNLDFRVTVKGGLRTVYRLDRWD